MSEPKWTEIPEFPGYAATRNGPLHPERLRIGGAVTRCRHRRRWPRIVDAALTEALPALAAGAFFTAALGAAAVFALRAPW